jgi:hypothetical protein
MAAARTLLDGRAAQAAHTLGGSCGAARGSGAAKDAT